jgi:hypothetical protein
MKLIMVFNNDDISKTLTNIISYKILNLLYFEVESEEFVLRLSIINSDIDPIILSTKFVNKYLNTEYILSNWEDIVFSNSSRQADKRKKLIIPKTLATRKKGGNRETDQEDKSIVLIRKCDNSITSDTYFSRQFLCLDVFKPDYCKDEYEKLKNLLQSDGVHPNTSNEGVACKWEDRFIILE